MEGYNKIMNWIDNCETYFEFKCGDSMIELYGKFFPEEIKLKQNLKDLQSDKYLATFITPKR